MFPAVTSKMHFYGPLWHAMFNVIFIINCSMLFFINIQKSTRVLQVTLYDILFLAVGPKDEILGLMKLSYHLFLFCSGNRDSVYFVQFSTHFLRIKCKQDTKTVSYM